MKVSAALPTGVAALFFESARRHRKLERRLVEKLEATGFEEVLLPVIDYIDPYERLPSLVERGELYRFVDRDGEVLALRSDFTPLLARLLAPRLASLTLPLKFFYRGDVLRYQEERAGRPREFYQLGAEVLSADGEQAERNTLQHFLDLLLAIGEREWRLVLGFAGALDQLLLAAPADLKPIDLAAAVARRERRIVRRAGKALLQIVEQGVPESAEDLGDIAAERLRHLQALRDDLAKRYPGISLRIDLAEGADQTLEPRLREQVGRRAYYDGMVFQAFAPGGALPIGGGGRYDRLFQKLGAEVAAAGFSLSLDRLLSRLKGDDAANEVGDRGAHDEGRRSSVEGAGT